MPALLIITSTGPNSSRPSRGVPGPRPGRSRRRRIPPRDPRSSLLAAASSPSRSDITTRLPPRGENPAGGSRCPRRTGNHDRFGPTCCSLMRSFSQTRHEALSPRRGYSRLAGYRGEGGDLVLDQVIEGNLQVPEHKVDQLFVYGSDQSRSAITSSRSAPSCSLPPS